jgi:hypothetical protein
MLSYLKLGSSQGVRGIFTRNMGQSYQESKECRAWTKRKMEREMDIVCYMIVARTVFTVNGTPLMQTSEFKYFEQG